MSLLDKLFSRTAPVSQGALLEGHLWLDQPDAHRQIDRKLKAKVISEEQAGKLRQWTDDGYLTFDIDLPSSIYESIDADVNRFWREKPADLPYAFDGPLKPFPVADETRERHSPYRIMDMHSHSASTLQLYLNRQIFEYVELILGEPAVAIQSIYFQFGSQQGHHRDPVFVRTTPPSHLVAGWNALEDIDTRSGALSYIPKTHKLPYFEFEPGRYVYDFNKDNEQKIWEMDAFNRDLVQKLGVEPRLYTPKRGGVLLWHASLLHGGSKLEDPSMTRKSFVVHYSTLKDYKQHGLTVLETHPDAAGAPVSESKVYYTDRILSANGCHGFDNPLRVAHEQHSFNTPS